MSKSAEINAYIQQRYFVDRIQDQNRNWCKMLAVEIADRFGVEMPSNNIANRAGNMKSGKDFALPNTRGDVNNMVAPTSDEIAAPSDLPKQFQEMLGNLKGEPKGEVNWREQLLHLQSHANFKDQFATVYDELNVKVDTDRPIGVTVFSDEHIGSPYAAYQQIIHHYDLVRENRYSFALKGGDMQDNFMPLHKAGAGTVLGQLVSPSEQAQICSAMLRQMAGAKKLLATIDGNHEQMSGKLTGSTALAGVKVELGIPYMPEGGVLNLTVGQITYVIRWHHSWRYHSNITKFNSHRHLASATPNCDAVILEHYHDPGILIDRPHPNKVIVNVRNGAYKIADSFSRRLYKPGLIAPQTLVFYPDRRHIEPFDGPDAIEKSIHFLKNPPTHTAVAARPPKVVPEYRFSV